MTGTGAAELHAGYVVRFGRLEQRGVLLGLSGPRLAWVASAVVVFVGAEFTKGWLGVAVSAPIWVSAAVVGGGVIAGRPVVEWVPLLGRWAWRRARVATQYRFNPTPARLEAELALPDRSRRRIHVTSEGVAVVQDRRADTVVVVAEVSGSGLLLADAGWQATRVTAWSRTLGGWCRREDISRVQVLHRITPGGGVAVRRWWVEHALDDESWASRVLAEAVTDAEAHTDCHQTLVAFALRIRGQRPGVLVAKAQRMLPVLTDMLAAADLTAEWLTPARLAHVVRIAYDPAAARLDLPPSGDPCVSPVGGSSRGMGPMGLHEHWDRLRTDTAWHATSWISQWPRTASGVDLLAPLIAVPGAHRAVSLTIEPIPTGRALRQVRRARIAHAADLAQRARAGRVEHEGMLAEADDVTRREQDLAVGHGDLAFTGLIVVTATTSHDLDGAQAAVETAAAQSMCELRRLSGQQAAAHVAAALPLAAGVNR